MARTEDHAAGASARRARIRRLAALLAGNPLEIGLVLIILTVIWLSVGSRLVGEKVEVERAAQRSAANIAGAAEQGIARTIEAIDQRLLFVREAYRRDPAEFDLNFLRANQGYVDGMMVQLAMIGPDGRTRLSNLGPMQQPPDLSDRQHFRVHLENPADFLFISVPVLGRVSQRWSVQFTRKMFAPDGSFAGVLVLSLDPYWLIRLYETLDMHGRMLLVGGDGVVRAEAPAAGLMGQTLAPALRDRLFGPTDHAIFRVRSMVDGSDRIAAFRRIRGRPLALTVSLDANAVFAECRQHRQDGLLIGSGLTVLVIGLGALLVLSKQRLLLSRRVLSGAVENIDQGLIVIEPDGRMPVVNHRVAELLGVPASLCRPGSDYAGLVRWQREAGEFGPPLPDGSFPPAPPYMNLRSPECRRVFERVRPDGTVLEVRTKRLPNGGTVRTYADISERRRAEERVRHLAHHDGLTGLANRVLLRDRLEQALAQAENDGDSVAALCLDLDRFKPVNDTLGHGAGDQLLVQVAERLRALARCSDIVARLGGDEFVLVQTRIARPADAAALAERVLDRLAEPFGIGGHEVLLGASIGIALFPADTQASGPDAVEALLKAADTALYRAKAAGRGTACFFEPAMEAELREHALLERDMRVALAARQFTLHFQPLFECRSVTPTGLEALLRWDHPVRGAVSPAKFIPTAEESGLIVPLGAWVLEEACAAAMRWPEPHTVAVNLSPAQFRRGNLPAVVAEILERTGLPPERLELEITENLLIDDAEGALAIIRALKQLGVRVALDDFGTGFSSLSYLRRFPFDKIKIDRSFVQAIGTDGNAAAIIQAILAMGHSLGMAVTAEGVETEQQLGFLREQGCDSVQGFLLARPLFGTKLDEFLLRGQPANWRQDRLQDAR